MLSGVFKNIIKISHTFNVCVSIMCFKDNFKARKVEYKENSKGERMGVYEKFLYPLPLKANSYLTEWAALHLYSR